MTYTNDEAKAVVAWSNTDADTAEYIVKTQKLIDLDISPTDAYSILEDLRINGQLVPRCEKHAAEAEA